MFDRWDSECFVRGVPTLPDDFVLRGMTAGHGRELPLARYYAKAFNDKHLGPATIPFQGVSMGLYHATQWRRVYCYGCSANVGHARRILPRIFDYV